MNTLFGKLTLDDRVADCPYETGLDLRPLLERFGRDVTWREIIKKDRHEIYGVNGFGSKTADRLYAFISNNVKYSFTDLLD